MSHLTISSVAHQVRLRSSAIRYYEKLGLLPVPERVGGQRRYDKTALYRLAVIQRARQAGFRLDEFECCFPVFRAEPGRKPAGENLQTASWRSSTNLHAKFRAFPCCSKD